MLRINMETKKISILEISNIVFCSWLVILMSGCSSPPVMATLLNGRPDPSLINSGKNGYIAFAPDTSGEFYLRADVKNNYTGEVFRLLLTPQHEKGSLPPVVLYQLPLGDYKFTQLYSGYGKKPSMTNINRNPFYIHKGAVTSFGRLSINVEEGVRLNIRNISVLTVHQNIDDLIKGFEDYGIAELNIRWLELSLVR